MFLKLKFNSFYLKYFFIEFNFFFYLLFKFNLKPINIVLIYLPKKIKKFNVLRSPFVSKLSKEHFKIENFSFIFFIKFFKLLFYIFYKKKLLSILNLYYFYIKLFYIEKFNLNIINLW